MSVMGLEGRKTLKMGPACINVGHNARNGLEGLLGASGGPRGARVIVDATGAINQTGIKPANKK